MSDQAVRIVGKPNVDKSSLFNKIVGQRISIAEDTPGVTRDRIYGRASWLGREFILIGTGRLDAKSDDTFTKNIRLQADIALETSNVIIFLVNGVESTTTMDRDLASRLEQTNKKIILAVSKSDSRKTKENMYDFYELGFRGPIFVSAEWDQRIGDLLDKVIEDFPVVDPDKDDPKIRVSFIGKPNVGKSSLINYISGENRNIVTNIPGTTRDSINSYFTYKDTGYIFTDTVGLRKRKKTEEKIEGHPAIRASSSTDQSYICVLMADATGGISEQDTKIMGYVHDQNKSLIITVDKWDAVEKGTSTMRAYEKETGEKLSFAGYAPLVFTPAKTGRGVTQLLDLINIVSDNYSLRIPTGVLNDPLNQTVSANQPPSDKGRRGKLFYGSQVSTRPPKLDFYVDNPELFHFTHRRFLKDQVRKSLSFDGILLAFNYKSRGKKTD